MTLQEIRRQYDDTYQAIGYAIIADGIEIGSASVIAGDDSPAYVERIDIDEDYRGQGHGSSALRMLSEMHDGIIIAPDNDDAARLYDRLGRAYNGSLADYLDQGFGVYEI